MWKDQEVQNNDSGDSEMQGDILARGGRSAQFPAGKSEVDAPIELQNVAPEEPGESKLGDGITVIDRRPNYGANLGLGSGAFREAPTVERKWPEKTYSAFSPILDRILVKRCAEGPDMKIMEDGSVLNTKTGLVIAAKYRQHSNIGIVLATGQFVILGGQRIAMSEVVRIGDRVTYGDYNSEVFLMDESKVQELCDAVQMNYEPDPEGLRIVRVQDVRGVERPSVETEPGLVGNNV
jgi:co-chaperonin GroES (HSP10)